VEYSFWRIRLPATGLTLPWQLVAEQEPGPMYLTGSLESVEGEAAAEETRSRAAERSARRERRLWRSSMK
jgi:hypothetical protein